jgi:hypothetical protein
VQYRIFYFFARDASGVSRIVVASHGLKKERTVPDLEINRAIARKQKFEADPAGHTFNAPGKE